jgi:tetratricopeptide (TPR) repeat protein
MDRGKQVVMAGLMMTLLGMPVMTGLWVSAGQAETTDSRKTEADLILKLCREQLQKQQYEAAIQACQEAAERLKQRGNRNGEARGITNLGIAHLNRSQPEKAISYFQQSLPMFQAEQDR